MECKQKRGVAPNSNMALHLVSTPAGFDQLVSTFCHCLYAYMGVHSCAFDQWCPPLLGSVFSVRVHSRSMAVQVLLLTFILNCLRLSVRVVWHCAVYFLHLPRQLVAVTVGKHLDYTSLIPQHQQL